MVITIQNRILNGQISCFFSNERFEKRFVLRILDFDLYCDDHFGTRVSSVRERPVQGGIES